MLRPRQKITTSRRGFDGRWFRERSQRIAIVFAGQDEQAEEYLGSNECVAGGGVTVVRRDVEEKALSRSRIVIQDLTIACRHSTGIH